MDENVTFKAGPKPSQSKMLRCGQLAELAHMSRMQIFRLARKRMIPGARRSKGGHFYFTRSPQLGEWIAQRRAKLAARWMRAEVQNAKDSDGRGFRWEGSLSLDRLSRWLHTRPKGFWNAERRAIWAERLKVIGEFAKQLER